MREVFLKKPLTISRHTHLFFLKFALFLLPEMIVEEETKFPEWLAGLRLMLECSEIHQACQNFSTVTGEHQHRKMSWPVTACSGFRYQLFLSRLFPPGHIFAYLCLPIIFPIVFCTSVFIVLQRIVEIVPWQRGKAERGSL